MFPNAFFKYFYFKMLFILKTRCYFIIIHTNKLEITLRSYLFNAFLICLALLYGRKPKTIFQKSLELKKKKKKKFRENRIRMGVFWLHDY